MVPEYPVWEIERAALRLLEDGYPKCFPESYVDVEWVIEEHLGLDIVPVPGLRRACETDGIICHYPRGKYFIVVDEEALDRRPHRYRFTLGEEAGHFVLHAKFLPPARTVEDALAAYRTMSNWKQLDRNARRFAAAVLMPMRTLVPAAERAYAQLVRAAGFGDPDTIKKYLRSHLAKAYGVSTEAMSFRLTEYPAHLDRRVDQALRERLSMLP